MKISDARKSITNEAIKYNLVEDWILEDQYELKTLDIDQFYDLCEFIYDCNKCQFGGLKGPRCQQEFIEYLRTRV